MLMSSSRPARASLLGCDVLHALSPPGVVPSARDLRPVADSEMLGTDLTAPILVWELQEPAAFLPPASPNRACFGNKLDN